MNRVFIVGDWRTGTGPANVTKQYIKHFPKGTRYQKFKSKVMRLPELYVKIFLSDIILFSGYSYQNVLGMKLAKRLKKKTAYIVHGAITHENKINHAEDVHMGEVEEETLRLADRLYAVSERFAAWLKNEYPQYEDKIFYVMNGVDRFKKISADNKRDKTSILSIGGGMPRKRILNICRAVEILNEEASKDEGSAEYTLYVIGKEGYDTEEIDKYDFVKDLGLVDADTKRKLFKTCSLFIQNSCFETFGLAPVEALSYGMSVLVSQVCGVLDLFNNARDEDIINDCEDIYEIASKIKGAILYPNNRRLLSDINMSEMSWKARAQELYDHLDKRPCW